MEPLGVIVGVDGDLATVGMYQMSNNADFLWDGDILVGPKVGAYLTILQNDIKIITTVVSEKIMDQQNTVKSKEFDNRYSANSINRIITLKTQGVIENNTFTLTSKYVPMVGNEVTITTNRDLNSIYNITSNESTICIGESVRESKRINLPINSLFASHIGIFGNTGSGKSNTLHKLYLELFQSKYKNKIFEKSKFFIIDFNGEYTQSNQFGVDNINKKVFEINTRKPEDTIPVTKKYLFDVDILSILFDAKPATQIPFLRTAMRKFKTIQSSKKFAQLECGLLESLFRDFKNIEVRSVEDWIQNTLSMGVKTDFLNEMLNRISVYYGKLRIMDNSNNQFKYVFDNYQLTSFGVEKFNQLKKLMAEAYDKLAELQKLKTFLVFQKIFVTAWRSTNVDFINPLFKRIESSMNSLEPIINVVDNLDDHFSALNIISLVNANQGIKRLVPMIISKMVYDGQKLKVTKKNKVTHTCHLIIDEAHNILKVESKKNSDSWQDYRLSVFEEIIKEGRKFGFFLTVCSQRPADISPIIMSQLHNFFIHRLINENDLRMLQNTVPTLDINTFRLVSSLGKGEAIVTGNAIKSPILLKVYKDNSIRPRSDDVILTDIWR
ncbi:ATP-binding protein [Lactobacillus mellis]|nr:ATP-binding protein [Bombilactobacillus mellis]